jgi:tRNA(fMet)-specific endonuclease VapC
MFLLDTNILSEIGKRRSDPLVLARFESTQAGQLFTSALCVEEIRFGCAIVPQGAVRWRRMQARVLDRVQVLTFDQRIALIAGDLRGEWKTSGTPIGYADGLIAATALALGIILVTRNTKHFDHVRGLSLENWFNPPPSTVTTLS